jgi:hypothetical protein
VQDIQVLWISQLHGRAQRMVEEFAHIGEGGMFKVCEDSDIDLFKPESILSDIWISPKDRQKHSLLGDSDVAESA